MAARRVNHRRGPDGTYIPAFKPQELMIHPGSTLRPRLRDVVPLGLESERYADIDSDDTCADDNSNDWETFAADAAFYPRNNNREYAIASIIVNRAKRAASAGKSWVEFEEAELAFNSAALIEAGKDPVRRKILKEDTLDDGLRLAIFSRLKVRLCEEVWLHPYTPTGGRTARKHSSMIVGLPIGTPNSWQLKMEEADRTVSRWELIDGRAVPIFKGELSNEAIFGKDTGT